MNNVLPTQLQTLASRVAAAQLLLLVWLVLSSAVYFAQDDAGTSLEFVNPLRPATIYLLTYTVTAAVAFVSILTTWHRTSPGFALLMAAYGLMHVVAWVFQDSDPVSDRTLVLRLNVCVLSICFQVLLSNIINLTAILSSVRWVALITSALAAGQVLLADYIPYRVTVFPGRGAGLYWDPNQCATFLAMMLPLINIGKAGPTRWFNNLAVLLGILFTFSREGILLWIVAVVLIDTLNPGGETFDAKRSATRLMAALGALAAISTLFAIGREPLVDLLKPYLTTDTYLRLRGTDEGSASERLLVLQMGLDLFWQHPLFGAGYASTRIWNYDVSVHNMFVLLLAEFGIVGAVWYFMFLHRIVSIPHRFGATVGVLVVVESLFTHSLFDLGYYILLILLYWRCAQQHAPGQPQQNI